MGTWLSVLPPRIVLRRLLEPVPAVDLMLGMLPTAGPLLDADRARWKLLSLESESARIRIVLSIDADGSILEGTGCGDCCATALGGVFLVDGNPKLLAELCD